MAAKRRIEERGRREGRDQGGEGGGRERESDTNMHRSSLSLRPFLCCFLCELKMSGTESIQVSMYRRKQMGEVWHVFQQG